MKTLFKPEIDKNPLYKKVYDADFSVAENEKELKKQFDTKLEELNNLIRDTLSPVKSITQVAEIFHYSALSASLLQHKAQYRYKEILAGAPKEHSLETMFLSQFKAKKNDEECDETDDDG